MRPPVLVKSITRRFIATGHKVIASGRRAERLQELKQELGDNLYTVQLDVRNRAAIEESHRCPARRMA